MATISNTPRPGYVWDSTDNVWYPIGTGPHTHADYITSGSAINPNIVDAKGDIIAATAADTVARLAVGSNDQVLTADSSTATGLKWATPSSGGMTLIQETVASANSAIDLTSIPGTYKQLLLIWNGIYHSTTGSGFSIRFNNDSTSKYEERAWIMKSGTANPVGYGTTGTSLLSGDTESKPFGYQSSDNIALTYPTGSLLIDNYASTSKLKFYQGSWYHQEAGVGAYFTFNLIGTYNSTSAITQINIVRLSGSATLSNRTNTSIRLYGIS